MDRNFYDKADGSEPVKESPSSRRAWIEILHGGQLLRRDLVALLAEGVDRNFATSAYAEIPAVALLAEGVDRNQQGHDLDAALQVALLAEGVDRN